MLVWDEDRDTPNTFSAAMVGAVKALSARVTDCLGTSYAQWQQYVVCSIQAVAPGCRAATVKPSTLTPGRIVRRVKALFLSHKVNCCNAP